jgi:uncharacterized membrane protein
MSGFLHRLRDEEGGQALVLVAIMMFGLVAVAGLVTDGGIVFTERRDLQNVADAAALAGASQIDENAYRSSGGSSLLLDQTAAYSAASEYLDNEGDLEYAISVAPQRVDVSVSRQAGTGFLRILGIDAVSISASANAAPRHGITAAEP